jgi:hypothetical protein
VLVQQLGNDPWGVVANQELVEPERFQVNHNLVVEYVME